MQSYFKKIQHLSPRMRMAIFLGLAVFLLYLLTWHAQFGGYEKETADAALRLLKGEYAVRRAGIGAIFLYIPFALIGKMFFQSHAYTVLTLAPLFYSAVAVSLLFLGLCEYTQQLKKSLVVSAVVVVGSMLWPYSNIGMEYQATMALIALWYAFVYWRRHDSPLIYVGLAYLFLVSVKSYGIAVGLPVIYGVYATMREKHCAKKFFTLSTVGSLLGPALAMFGVMMMANVLVYHTVGGAYRLTNEFQVWSWWEGIYGTFFSIGKSIVWYNPLLLIAFAYAREWFKRDHITVAVVSGFFLILLLITAPFSYWSDETWSVRKLMPIIPLLHIPLIYFLDACRNQWRKYFFIFLLCLAVYVQILGVTYVYDKHLHMLRAMNVDSLSTMRYIPALAQTTLYHRLLVSYLHLGPQQFHYSETTWFRWLHPGDQDIALRQATIDLTLFDTPDILWLTRPTRLKFEIAGGILVLFFVASWQLVHIKKITLGH